jgi:FixJ family two-component response regulator
MNKASELVYLIENDPDVSDEIKQFLALSELEVRSFERAVDYFAYTRSDSCACLIIEMEMKDIRGLDLQRQLDPQNTPPIIFISDCACVKSTVAAMKAGAVEFLIRPFEAGTLHKAVESALSRDRVLRRRRSSRARLNARFSSLTPRQREVFPLIIGGLLNKQAAALLNISEVTLQIHRSEIMRKMEAGSLAELVRMALELRIRHWQRSHGARWKT